MALIDNHNNNKYPYRMTHYATCCLKRYDTFYIDYVFFSFRLRGAISQATVVVHFDSTDRRLVETITMHVADMTKRQCLLK